MIFRKELIPKIHSGAKTQTRRLKASAECSYRAGHTYAVQPAHDQVAVARILVTDVRDERLGDLDPVSAQREGFKRMAEFFAYWERLYGAIDLDMVIWVITFELDRDPVRLLHKDSSRGYTHNPRQALDEEPEAIPASVTNHYAETAHDADELRSAHRLQNGLAERQALEDRLGYLLDQAQQRGVDVRSERRVIERRVEAIERKVRREHAA